MVHHSIQNDLPEDQLIEALKRYRDNTENNPDGDPTLKQFFLSPLNGHEDICNCATCDEVRDAALRQFDQLMEHQCLYYIIQVSTALDALCKTALLRWLSNDPGGLTDYGAVNREYMEIAGPMADYMAHPDTMAVTWRGVQKAIAKQIAQQRK